MVRTARAEREDACLRPRYADLPPANLDQTNLSLREIVQLADNLALHYTSIRERSRGLSRRTIALCA